MWVSFAPDNSGNTVRLFPIFRSVFAHVNGRFTPLSIVFHKIKGFYSFKPPIPPPLPSFISNESLFQQFSVLDLVFTSSVTVCPLHPYPYPHNKVRTNDYQCEGNVWKTEEEWEGRGEGTGAGTRALALVPLPSPPLSQLRRLLENMKSFISTPHVQCAIGDRP